KNYGNRALTGEEIRWGLENLDVTPERIEELGMTGLMVPVKVTCANHEGLNPGVKVQQWDGKQWNVIVDFVPALTDIVRPVIEEEAMKYAEENNITPRDCG
ncbi:MAG: ABC transporter permease, partial [Gammaproteobacteria bacterium]|nr:ABC transporter permease [Gammaproteobacteria bacterium]